MRGNSGVAGEGRVVDVPKFHSWGKCTMPLTNINLDWMYNASSGLCIILGYTVEPPNRGHFGTAAFVLSSEVVLFSEVV